MPRFSNNFSLATLRSFACRYRGEIVVALLAGLVAVMVLVWYLFFVMRDIATYDAKIPVSARDRQALEAIEQFRNARSNTLEQSRTFEYADPFSPRIETMGH